MLCVPALHSFYCQATLHCMNISYFVHSPGHIHFYCFQFLLIINNLCTGHNVFSSLGKHLRRRITGPYGKCMCKKSPNSFLKHLCHFASLPTRKVPITFHPLNSWYSLFLNLSHSNRGVVISHFLSDNCQACFHVPISHPDIFFSKMSTSL